MKLPDQLKKLDKWDETIRKLIPKDSFEAINLSEYLSLIKQKYASLYTYPNGADRSFDLIDVEIDNFEVDVKRL